MYDGKKHTSGFIFNTSGFTLDDVKILQAVLLENWFLETSIHSRNRLYVNSKSKSKFIELVRPPFYLKMLYKID